MRRVEDVNYIACMDSVGEKANKLSHRLINQFFVIGLELLDQNFATSLLNKILEIQSNGWPSLMQPHVSKLSCAIFDLYERCT